MKTTEQLIKESKDLRARRQVERSIEDVAHDVHVAPGLHSAYQMFDKPIPACYCRECRTIRDSALEATSLALKATYDALS